ncbi:LacI family DNA-binding transcriptional regulator [Kitasatospora atroaurantiaca]|uniref:LacI family transcriptional regulator n=1 Tax=Kitasatospora atroaurantiaca TaxID=285545 RepID=A0A561EXL2_9ACTN|nr:LacI family DNA-binding transcriptional regulator [Kitasatospora atroaurantiaca]TWE20350.1 LacI family transcriptional regulator [Kitasatospora atroaurantiaca]
MPPEQRPTPHITSADVARAAGVSRTTVSFVLNRTPSARISETTRAKVLAAAEQLGYVPHAAARSLRAGRSDLVVLPASVSAMGRLFSDWVDELETALGSRGYTVVLHGDRSTDPVTAARAWAQLRPAAVMAMGGARLTPEAVQVLAQAGTKAVVTVSAEPVEGVFTLIGDQADIGIAATEHLIARGRSRIGVVMPMERGLSAFAEPRLAGARRVAADRRAEITPLPMRYSDEAAAALAVLCRELGLDAVFGYNDEYAALLSAALADCGVAVPEQIAVVGADDLLLARVVRPRLTSVRYHLPGADLMAEAVDRLITGGSPAPLPRIRFEVLPRQSS